MNTYSNTLNNIGYELEQSTSRLREGLTTIFNYYKEIEKILMTSISKISSSIFIKRRAIRDVAISIKKEFQRLVRIVDNDVANYWRISFEPSFAKILSNVIQRVDLYDNVIHLNDPVRQLRHGYSITRNRGNLVRSIRDVEIGDLLKIQVSDGEIESEVKGKGQK